MDVDFWTLVDKFGITITLLVYGILALYFDWVVSGKRYREIVRQRDRLLGLALQGQRKAGQTLDLAEALIPRKEDESDEGA